jgi:hypothetical protein
MPKKDVCIGMVWKLFISAFTVLKFLRIKVKPRDLEASLPQIRSSDNV